MVGRVQGIPRTGNVGSPKPVKNVLSGSALYHSDPLPSLPPSTPLLTPPHLSSPPDFLLSISVSLSLPPITISPPSPPLSPSFPPPPPFPLSLGRLMRLISDTGVRKGYRGKGEGRGEEALVRIAWCVLGDGRDGLYVTD